MNHSPRFVLATRLLCVAALGGVSLVLARACAGCRDGRSALYGCQSHARGRRVGVSRIAGSSRARALLGIVTAVAKCCSSRKVARACRSAAARCASSRSARATTRAPNVEHWHGATPDSEFTQVALSRGDASETVWLEKVTDAQYAGR